MAEIRRLNTGALYLYVLSFVKGDIINKTAVSGKWGLE